VALGVKSAAGLIFNELPTGETAVGVVDLNSGAVNWDLAHYVRIVSGSFIDANLALQEAQQATGLSIEGLEIRYDYGTLIMGDVAEPVEFVSLTSQAWGTYSVALPMTVRPTLAQASVIPSLAGYAFTAFGLNLADECGPAITPIDYFNARDQRECIKVAFKELAHCYCAAYANRLQGMIQAMIDGLLVGAGCLSLLGVPPPFGPIALALCLGTLFVSYFYALYRYNRELATTLAGCQPTYDAQEAMCRQRFP
jgi:hypothetical protein